MTDISEIGLPPAAEKSIRRAWQESLFDKILGGRCEFELCAESLAAMTDEELSKIPYVGPKATEKIREWGAVVPSLQVSLGRIGEGTTVPHTLFRPLDLEDDGPSIDFSAPAEVFDVREVDRCVTLAKMVPLAREILLALVTYHGKATPDLADQAKACAERFFA